MLIGLFFFFRVGETVWGGGTDMCLAMQGTVSNIQALMCINHALVKTNKFIHVY